VIGPALTKQDVLEAIRSRHVYATDDKNLRLIFRVNGSLLGERLSPPQLGSNLQIEFTLVDDDEPEAAYTLEVYAGTIGKGPAVKIEAVPFDSNQMTAKKVEDVDYNGESYFFFKLIQINEDGHIDETCTAPMWVDAGAAGPPEPPLAPVAVASKHSAIFHISADCLDAKAIKPQNLLRAQKR
jgi:hypothetical protein